MSDKVVVFGQKEGPGRYVYYAMCSKCEWRTPGFRANMVPHVVHVADAHTRTYAHHVRRQRG